MARWSRFGRRARQAALGAAVVGMAAGMVVGVSAPTGADEVHLELATSEQSSVPDGRLGLPLAMNRSGSTVGLSNPPDMAVAWPRGSSSVYLGRVERYSELFAVNDSDLAFGLIQHGTFENPGAMAPALFDLRTQVWTELSLPDGWWEKGRALSASGMAIAEGGLLGAADPTVLVWPDPSGPVVQAPVVGHFLTVTPNGRILIQGPGENDATWWDPATGSVEAVALPFPDVLVLAGNGRGQYLLGRAETARGVAWDSTTGVMTAFDSDGRFLNEAGQALVRLDGVWQVIDVASGATTVMKPFGLDVPGDEIVPVDFDENARVLANVRAPGVERVVVWSAAEHTVDLGPTNGPDALSPALLGDDGVAVGTTGDARAWWRATFRLAPNAPTSLAGQAGGASVALSWQAPTSPGDAPIDTYVVKADGVEVAQVDAASLTWSGAGDGSAAYTVVAVNTYGESSPSNAVVLAAGAVSVTPAFTG
jgi:hypothetical protein